MNKAFDELTALDWIAVLVVGGLLGALLLFPCWPAATFVEMYRDFGTAARLPCVTRLVVTSWFAPMLTLLPLAWLTFAVKRERTLAARRWLVVASFLFAAGALGFCISALYRPIFMLAQAIR